MWLLVLLFYYQSLSIGDGHLEQAEPLDYSQEQYHFRNTSFLVTVRKGL